MFQYQAQVIRIVDGDTIWLDIDLGFRMHMEIDVRLAGVNTPETVSYKVGGIVDPAAVYVAKWIPPGATCVVDISKPDKYGRWLARIMFQPGVVDRMKILENPRVLNDELIAEGLAKAYSGGKK